VSPRPSDVTAVVCTRNAEASIELCLRSLRENGVGQVVVVDASSTDNTAAIARRYADELVTDPGVGLGTARNIGVRQATRAFVLNCGADNVLPPGSLSALLEAKQAGQWDGVSAVTLVIGCGYLSWAMRKYKLARFTPGERAVIGTPTLFDTAKLQNHPFDDSAAFSDDSELCERWTRLFGARFAIANALARVIKSASASRRSDTATCPPTPDASALRFAHP
jgi:glycosyltransferase involved in cell wall biosynthesis